MRVYQTVVLLVLGACARPPAPADRLEAAIAADPMGDPYAGNAAHLGRRLSTMDYGVTMPLDFAAAGDEPHAELIDRLTRHLGASVDDDLQASLEDDLGDMLGPSLGTSMGANLGPDVARVIGSDLGRTLGPEDGATLGDDMLGNAVRHRDPDRMSWGPRVEDALVDMTAGAALTDRMNDFSAAEQSQWGVANLTADELLGTEANDFTDGLCEDPHALFSFRDDGATYDADFPIPKYWSFVGDISRMQLPLSDACKAGLLADGGDVDAAVADGTCAVEERMEFFDDDAKCSACVEGNGGDFDACVTAKQCPSEADAIGWIEDGDGNRKYYQWLVTYMFACAPSWVMRSFLYADLDDRTPSTFDHQGWAYLCLLWNEGDGSGPQWYCDAGQDGPDRGSALGEGTPGYVSYIREDAGLAAQTGKKPFDRRGYYVDSFDFPANDIYYFWAWSPGIGAVSTPTDYADTNGDGVVGPGDVGYGFAQDYAWGLNPNVLRPDGSDPTDPTDANDTYALDWVAVEAMKASTTHSGFWVTASDHSRCQAWTTASDGTSTCTALGAPEPGWLSDGEVFRPTTEQAYTYPRQTLASSGMPDRDVPGGYVVDERGTVGEADADWDGCAWPNIYTPDRIPVEDAPYSFGTTSTVTYEAFRFGREDADDVRATMNTNVARGYCAAGPDGD